jgi:hypothetical protein
MTRLDIECIDFVKLIMAKIELNVKWSMFWYTYVKVDNKLNVLLKNKNK